jgi:hypothetical protein
MQGDKDLESEKYIVIGFPSCWQTSTIRHSCICYYSCLSLSFWGWCLLNMMWFIKSSNWLHFGSWILTLHFRVQWNSFKIWQDGEESRSSTLEIIRTVI